MKIHKLLFLVLVVTIYASISSFSPALGKDDPDTPRVVQAVPPSYPPIARAANVSGVVLVEVKINARGFVTAVRIIEGQKPLTLSAERAASKWKFNALDKAKERSVQLRFEFILIPTNKGTPEDLGVVFWPPYKVEIKDAPYRVN